MAPPPSSREPVLALVPSPLVGAAVWQPLASRLEADGWSVHVCRTPDRPTSAREVLESMVASLPTGEPVVLVPHSNAGLFVPAVAHGRDILATVFVDAALPPMEGRATLVPAPHQAFLAGLAEADGLLPPWTTWWGEEQVAGLFPDLGTRRTVEAQEPRLRLSYVQETVDVPAGWARTPSAYLAFGDTYAEERELATRRGWPVTTLPGTHLHMLVEPDAVAGAVIGLLGELGVVDGGLAPGI